MIWPSALPYEIALAFGLDMLIGDPRFIPHPVAGMGRLIAFLEPPLRRVMPKSEVLCGGLLAFIVIGVSAGIAFAAYLFLRQPGSVYWRIISGGLMIYLLSTAIALRGLFDSAFGVVTALVKKSNITEARKRLSMIVGRDTASLDSDAILRADIETVAENLSDGVIGPLFYMALGGLPLAFFYKAVNTLDSMVGYKNERYIKFGRVSARLDDAMNYIPARLTGVLIIFSAHLMAVFSSAFTFADGLRSWRIMIRDGKKHPSPNAGLPESAMAGALGVRLGGPSYYGGVLSDKPWLGDGDGPLQPAGYKSLALLALSGFSGAGLAVGISFFISASA